MIFVRCSNCGNKTQKDWAYCPVCGSAVERFSFPFVDFTRIFNKLVKQFEENENEAKQFEAFDMAPLFRQKPGVRGYSISITSAAGQEPKVSVKTFGNASKEDVEKNINILSSGRQKMQLATRVEEPNTAVRRLSDAVVVEMDMPGISEKNIGIVQLRDSIEVKAIAKDKAYFKIVNVPRGLKLASKKYSDGKLSLKFLF